MKWLVNGVESGKIAADDRGLAYGDGLFETIAVRAGEPRLFAEHLARLREGSRRLQLPPPAKSTLAEQAQRLIVPPAADGTLKIIYTRGSGERGYAPPIEPDTTLAVGFSAGVRAPVDPAGVTVRLCATPVGRNPQLAGLKTLNRLEQVLARAEWRDSAVAEGLLFDTAGLLVCGTMTNVFIVRENRLLTPRLDQCGVHGVMRAQVLAAAARLGVYATEQRLTRASLEQADEVFLTNSQIGIWPVARLNTLRYAGRPLTDRLRAELARSGIGDCA